MGLLACYARCFQSARSLWQLNGSGVLNLKCMFFNVNLSLHGGMRYVALVHYYSTISNGPSLEELLWFLPCNVHASFNAENCLTT